MIRREFEVRGVRQLNELLEKTLARDVPEFAARGLYQVAEAIMAESKQLVPVDTGALRASGHVETPVFSGNAVSVQLTYGGPAAPYAILVHEVPAAHAPPTQWKYLETPVLAAAEALVEELAQYLQDRIGGPNA